ncbi:MAG: DUF1800 family protein, partial [Actinomycetota bacterium]
AADADPVGAMLRATSAGATVDPWRGAQLPDGGEGRRLLLQGWLAHVSDTPTPFLEWRTELLAGWLVTSLAGVPAALLADQIRLLRDRGGGSFPLLLHDVTIDPAMLLYLDGATSRAGAPNENHARELLELFALGTGRGEAPQPYSESDVAAAAVALTGWTVRRTGEARFVAARHDDTPQTLLGASGVHDVATVIAAIVEHPEHDRFVADRIAREVVGTAPTVDGDRRPDPATVDVIAEAYRTNDRSIDGAIEAAARLVFDGGPTPTRRAIVTAPIRWAVSCARILGVDLADAVRRADRHLQEMGQIPFTPPTVAGWPGGEAWLTTGALVARTNVAASIARGVSDGHPVSTALSDGDLDQVATLLGIPESFTATTAAAIRGASDPSGALTLALVSPEFLLT